MVASKCHVNLNVGDSETIYFIPPPTQNPACQIIYFILANEQITSLGKFVWKLYKKIHE